MTGGRFASAFAADLDKYLAFKQAMGCYGASRIWYLGQFDAYCLAHDQHVFDRHTVEGWVTEQLTRSGRYRSWMSYIRDFGRWLRIHRDPDAYVLSDRWKAPFVPAHPYLLTRRAIEAFFAAAAVLDAQSPWRWQAVAFFALMHSCGLRTGEARALLTEHVDLPHRRIDIVWAKGNRSRRLPVNRQITEILTRCQQTSVTRFGSGRRYFFVSAAGNQMTGSSVATAFARIWTDAGLSWPSDGKRPCPYDFRHHFAYANIERWMAEGADVAALLPYLSRYMGHATVESTYYYIHTSPDFMDAYAQLPGMSGSLLPEVGFE